MGPLTSTVQKDNSLDVYGWWKHLLHQHCNVLIYDIAIYDFGKAADHSIPWEGELKYPPKDMSQV
jgi:hypothetical protein